MTGVSGWLRESLAAAVRSTGRAQVLLARDTGLSEKHVSQMLTGRVTGSLEAWEDLLAAANVSPANLLAQPTVDEAEGDELTQDERRDLGCHCTRLDDKWHHVRGCVVPGVEILLKRRAALATPPTPEHNGLGGGSENPDSHEWLGTDR